MHAWITTTGFYFKQPYFQLKKRKMTAFSFSSFLFLPALPVPFFACVSPRNDSFIHSSLVSYLCWQLCFPGYKYHRGNKKKFREKEKRVSFKKPLEARAWEISDFSKSGFLEATIYIDLEFSFVFILSGKDSCGRGTFTCLRVAISSL